MLQILELCPVFYTFGHQVELQPVPLPGDPAILSELRDAGAQIGRGTTPAEIDDDGTILLPR